MIKLMQTLLSHGRTLGIQRPEGNSLMNRRNIIVLLIYVFYFLMANAYLVFTAKTFREYSICFFVYLTLFCMIIGFGVMIFQVPLLFELLDSFEEEIEKRK